MEIAATRAKMKTDLKERKPDESDNSWSVMPPWMNIKDGGATPRIKSQTLTFATKQPLLTDECSKKELFNGNA